MGRPGLLCHALYAPGLQWAWHPLELCIAVALVSERGLAVPWVGDRAESPEEAGAQCGSQRPVTLLAGAGRRKGFMGGGPSKA